MAELKKKKNQGSAKESQDLVKDEYTKEEKVLVDNYLKRSRKHPAKFKNVEDDSHSPQVGIEEKDKVLAAAKLMESLGTPYKRVQSYLINQVLQTFKDSVSSTKGFNNDRLAEFSNSAIALLQGIGPQDEVEGMLAVQMVGIHNMAMTAMGRAMITDQTFEGRQAAVSQAAKLLRTFTAQMEALKKYRTGGQQKMTVEHVHVNEGGQAIVGTVNQGGGGKDEKSE